MLDYQNDSLLSQTAWLEYVKRSCQVKNDSWRPAVQSCAQSGPKEGFGVVLVPAPSAVHRPSLSTRRRCWTGHGPGVPARTGVTSPESPPSASVSPFPSVLRNGDQCDTEQLDVIKPPKEVVKPHPCFRKPRSNQMPPGSSA